MIMNDQDFKEELKEIENTAKAFKNSLIAFVITLLIAVIIHLTSKDNRQTMLLAYFFYLVAAISWICILVFKFKELKLLTYLTHKRLDELVDKYEQLKKKS